MQEQSFKSEFRAYLEEKEKTDKEWFVKIHRNLLYFNSLFIDIIAIFIFIIQYESPNDYGLINTLYIGLFSIKPALKTILLSINKGDLEKLEILQSDLYGGLFNDIIFTFHHFIIFIVCIISFFVPFSGFIIGAINLLTFISLMISVYEVFDNNIKLSTKRIKDAEDKKEK